MVNSLSEFNRAYQDLSERDKKVFELCNPAKGEWAGYYDDEWWVEK